MKTRINSHREQAVALIIVLAMLVLLSGLIVSFMTSVGNERAASVASNNGLTSRQLADSTVNLVISQIREATSQSGSDATVPTTWASQPGAIRTLSGSVGGLNPTKGNPLVKQFSYQAGTNDHIFKLYSSGTMKIPASAISGKAWDTNETNLIEQWDWTLSESDRDKKKLFGYVDLNEPVVSPLPSSLTKNDPKVVEPRYPIIDPRAKFDATESPNATADPGVVEGFDIKTTKLSDPNLKFISKDRTGKKGDTQKVQYLPMPVKWLYVMRDGSMAAADDGGKILGASRDNPIIGRTAFWTDDESCKLNINTASEGTFWDTPTASSIEESGNVADNSGALGGLNATQTMLSLGASQPSRGEYQRYPGHPFTTCLSPALGWMWGIMPKDLPKPTRDGTLIAMKDAIAQISPFTPYSYNSSQLTGLPPPASPRPPQSTSMGGAYNPDPNADAISDPKLAVGTKRLYTTVDELIFKSDRAPASLTTPTTLNSPNLNPDSLEKVRFFLTANSRSPELNLFGRPRVTFWPVSAKEELRTSYDDLFAFTSTLYKDPSGNRDKDNTFFFTRYDAKSAVNDYKTTPNGAPPNKNEKIMNYLQLMTGNGSFKSIPGFGGNFAAKYPGLVSGTPGAERNQILMEIFDYCRTVNLVDTSTRNRVGAFQPYTPFFGPGSGYQAYSTRSKDWSGQVTPIRFDSASFLDIQPFQGLGRFPTISEAALIFYRTGDVRKKKPDGTAGGDYLQAELRAALIFEMMNPMAGNPAIRETFWTTVRVVRPTIVDVPGAKPPVVAKDINLVASIDTADKPRINICNVASHDVGWSRGYMPSLGFMNQVHFYPEPATPPVPDAVPPTLAGQVTPKIFDNKNTSSITYKRGVTSTIYPYVSDKFLAPEQGAATTLKFKGGEYIVEIWSGEAPDDTRSQLVQTIHLDFDKGKQVTVDAPVGKVSTDAVTNDASLDKRITGKQDDRPGFPNGNGFEDVVRSIEYVGAKPDAGTGKYVTLPLAQQGDFRLSMARRDVPAEFFAPRSPSEYYTAAKSVHGLQRSWGDYYEGFKPASAAPADPTKGRGTFATGAPFRNSKSPILPAGINGVKTANGGSGDWDRGLSKHMDGSLGGKVDEGNVWFNYADSADGGMVPYFRGRGIEETGKSFFSPNRQISSAVMFGSLPTGVVRGLPWQTLLFRPDRGAPHPGAQAAGKPADHLMLDLFNLPIVEPYAISEPFSSGGKINLNYVIAPFGYAKGDAGKRGTNQMDRSYLRRDTALRGILKAVKIMAVPTTEPSGGHTDGPANTTTKFRYDIDAEKTLDQFEDRLKDPSRGLFRSASEICDMDLYPVGLSVTDWGAFWETNYAQTGDNMRERPYSHIYPRVTTKSNTYTVYMRCQAVKKVAGTAPDEFDSTRDKVVGEYRGNATIERFIDPNDKDLANYDPSAANASVDKYYRFRVVGTKQFLPR